MAVNKSKARKVKRRLAYVYFPIIFAVLGVLIARFVFVAIVPDYQSYRTIAFGDPPAFSEQIDRKSFVAYEGKESKSFNNISTTLPKYNQQYGEIKCSRLDIDAPVFWGDSDLVLRAGAGTYSGSSLPGYGGSILISAHNTTFFEGLQDAQVGDEFKLTTTYAAFTYRISEIKVRKADDASAVNFGAKEEKLVLYTCYPFRPLAAVSDERLFVYCDKIAGPSAKNVEVDL